MIKYFNYKKAAVWDDGERVSHREYEIEACKVETDFKTYQEYKKLIERQTGNEHYYHAIDKLTFSFPRDYLKRNFDSSKYKNGPFSINVNRSYFSLHIHKEYLPIDTSIEDSVKNIFKYIIYCKDVFVLPLKKTSYDYISGEVREYYYPENKVDTEEEFVEKIYSKRILKCIELCFDMHLNIRKFLDISEFRIFKSTLYSKDYTVYSSGNVKTSLICIYDKAKQLLEKKHKDIGCTLWRFEIRLYSTSFSVMKKNGGKDLLNCTYEELVMKLLPYIRKRVKKQRICFERLLEVLPDSQHLLRIILENL